jgi:outer membrane protein TolC
LAQRRVDIYERSLALAQRQLKEIEHRIRVGDLPETELAAARAESALREEELINARGALATAFLRLRRLIDPELLAEPRPELARSTEPAAPDIRLGPVSAHVALAFNMRAELNEARLRVQRNDLELVRTRNGLLPKLDFFIALGLTGYARSFGDSMTEMDGDHYAVSGGLRLEFPVGNRAAGARHQRAQLTREQSAEALRNLTDLVQVEVESAYIDVERTRAQITATATTRQFQEEKVYAETQKYEVGRSTSLLVTQAQRDLVQSQVAEATAVVRYLEALVALYRLEGTLLERRGLAAADRLPANEAFNPAPY